MSCAATGTMRVALAVCLPLVCCIVANSQLVPSTFAGIGGNQYSLVLETILGIRTKDSHSETLGYDMQVLLLGLIRLKLAERK